MRCRGVGRKTDEAVGAGRERPGPRRRRRHGRHASGARCSSPSSCTRLVIGRQDPFLAASHIIRPLSGRRRRRRSRWGAAAAHGPPRGGTRATTSVGGRVVNRWSWCVVGRLGIAAPTTRQGDVTSLHAGRAPTTAALAVPFPSRHLARLSPHEDSVRVESSAKTGAQGDHLHAPRTALRLLDKRSSVAKDRQRLSVRVLVVATVCHQRPRERARCSVGRCSVRVNEG